MEGKVIPFSKVGRNDLCPCGSGKKHKKCCLQKVVPHPKETGPAKDVDARSVIRSIKKTMAQIEEGIGVGDLPIQELRDKLIGKSYDEISAELDGRKRSPEYTAQQLVYDAWEMEDTWEKVDLAEKAIEIWPDCADAYSILSDELATTPKEQMHWIQLAVAAGERALGKNFLKENQGHFWGMLETRPYMRARFSLAQLLWLEGKTDEAVAQCWDLLKLNPDDNQGVRLILMNWLLAMQDHAGVEKLFKKFKGDCFAEWAYSKVLYHFQIDGPGEKPNKALLKAVKVNPHVLPYLKKPKSIPKELPHSYSMGSDDEAMIYAAQAIDAWKGTPGALAWIKEQSVSFKRTSAPPK